MTAQGSTDADGAKTKTKMQIFVSAVVLLAALWVVLSRWYDDTYLKWAFGIIGVIVGYWLK